MRRWLLRLISFYQRYLNFDGRLFRTLFLTDKACRFHPSCSDYAYQAIERYGTVKGLFLALARVVRCHPGSRGGFDPVR